MAPMVLLAAWLASNQLQALDARYLREAGNLAHNFMLSNDRYLEARLKALNILAISPLADDPQRWPELYRGAQGFQQSFGAHVSLADEQGRRLFSTRQPFGSVLPPIPVPKGRSAAQLALQTGKPQVGDIVFGPMADLPLVAIAVPVLRDGSPPRLLLATLEAPSMQARADQVALPEGWALALRDGTGTDIARRAPAGFNSARDVADDHRFVVRSKLSDWSAVLEIPRGADAASQREALLSLPAAALLAIGLGLAGGVLASRRIGR